MEKYQIKSEIEHILDRSGMYMGSTSSEIISAWLYKPSINKIIQVENTITNAGLLKTIDEIISNSVDEHRRNDSLFDITEICVDVQSNGVITVRDNGGISVTKHKQTGILIPELIFGMLRTSSNYDDTQERNVIGTNGLGSKLTNIFSSLFEVITCDGKNKVTVTWKNNMRDVNVSEIVKTKEHFTQIKFQLELERFDLTEQKIPLSIIRLIQKRCIDACACNPKLNIKFTTDLGDGKLNSEWGFNSFSDYVKLYVTPEILQQSITTKSTKYNLCLVPTNQLNSVAFVNGALCSDGTHIKSFQKQITTKLLEWCNKNDMELITERDIISRICIFADCVIKNPTYDSQTKERLTNKISSSELKLDSKFLNQLIDSEFTEMLKNFYSAKYAEVQKKETRKLNSIIKNTKSSKKLIGASGSSSNKELWLFEGNSASNGFRKHRNPLTQSAYLLRGKLRNTFDLKRNQIVENQELREIIALLELQFGEPSKNIKRLKYNKIIIASDADYDGSHICGLIMAFFVKHFPELITNLKIYRALSPIIIVQHTKKNTKQYFYTMEEFEAAKDTIDYKNNEVRYTKGLGGLSDDDYAIMLRQQKLLQFKIEDSEDVEAVSIWFEKSTAARKEELLNTDQEEQ